MGKEKQYILFNKMYTGEFTENNIGHEIINLFKTDKGENYIYVVPYGGVSRDRNNKVSCILLTSPMKNGSFEILAKACELEQIVLSGDRGSEEIHAAQLKYVEEHDIKYGNKPINIIMVDNKNNYKAIYVTFKANRVFKARKPIIVKQSELPPELDFNLQRSKAYCDDSVPFFKEIINDEKLWEEKNTTDKVNLKDFQDVQDKNFLQLIRKEDDENVFSNMFYYYLSKNENIFDDFCKCVLKIHNLCKDDVIIQREKYTGKKEIGIDNSTDEISTTSYKQKRIDIWIETREQTVVIENKVKSGINGSRHDLESKEVISQLEDYMRFSNEIKNKKHYYFIFAPDYNDIPTDANGKYKNYAVIRYSELHRFFKDKVSKPKVDEYGLYDQFVNALAKHIYTADKEMERRFVLAITKAKNPNQ